MELRKRSEEAAEVAVSNSRVSSRKYKEYFDRKSSSRKFKINDEVLLILPTSANKLIMQWKGPYIITGEHSNGVDYYVKVGNRTKIYHANMLKSYRRRENLVQKQCLSIHHSSELFDSVQDVPVSEISQYDSLNSVDNSFSDGINLFESSETAKVNVNISFF